MTDQLLVPRELLERALKADHAPGRSATELCDGWKALDELETLLAQPASEPKPVAHQIMWADDKTHYCFCRDEDRMDKISKDPAFLCIPLFTHPAPAEVVLPGRKTRVFLASYEEDEYHQEGWNACLDEVKRLNNL